MIQIFYFHKKYEIYIGLIEVMTMNLLSICIIQTISTSDQFRQLF